VGSPAAAPATPTGPILAVSFLASVGTGVTWSGLSFIAEADFGYGKTANFALASANGVAYATGAFLASRMIRAAERFVSPRGMLAVLLLVQAAIAPAVLLPVGSWILWAVGILVSLASAIFWPLVESYLAGGRRRDELRHAMGAWNLSWMIAVGLSLAIVSPLGELGRMRFSVVAILPACLAAILFLPRFTPRPAAHPEEADGPVPPNYAALLASARVLLPVSYVVIGAISPLLPYLLGKVGADSATQTPLAATWLFSRAICVGVLWKLGGWHGKSGALVLGGTLLAGGFTLAVLAPSMPVLAAGLAVFGVGQGIIYSAAIYYAMSVGKAEIDAAGTHEGLIGVGYLSGPLLGLATSLAGGADGAYVATILGLMALSAVPAVRPLLRRSPAVAP
jgi:MFS family permease